MLRISTVPGGDGIARVRIEGVLAEDGVDALAEVCRGQQIVSPRFVLDFSEVTYANNAGLAYISLLRRSGVEIAAISPFISEALRRSEP